YAVVRADADRLSMTGRLYDWLRTEAGKAVIAESGYVPTEATADVATVDLPAVRIYPNPVTDGFRVSGAALERESPARLTLTDLSGRVRLSVQVTGGEYVDARSLPKGVYIAVVAAGKYSVPVKMIKR
ncbi:MAG: T9SS type A sorting domain-containing protein, partial [Tannerella sp.]|nr:T9SS type A sorting domain-containing protein [Tannerella sp.]